MKSPTISCKFLIEGGGRITNWKLGRAGRGGKVKSYYEPSGPSGRSLSPVSREGGERGVIRAGGLIDVGGGSLKRLQYSRDVTYQSSFTVTDVHIPFVSNPHFSKRFPIFPHFPSFPKYHFFPSEIVIAEAYRKQPWPLSTLCLNFPFVLTSVERKLVDISMSLQSQIG